MSKASKRRAQRKTRNNNMQRRPRRGSRQLPSPFNRLSNDSVVVSGKGVLQLTTYSVNYSGGHIGMWPKTTEAPHPISLATFMPSLHGLALVYDQFVVLAVRAKIVNVMSEETGAILTAGYTSGSNTLTDPSLISNVMGATHSVMVGPGKSGTFSVQPYKYFDDWTPTSTDLASAGHNGAIRWIPSYHPSAGYINGFMELSFEIAFAGLRSA